MDSFLTAAKIYSFQIEIEIDEELSFSFGFVYVCLKYELLTKKTQENSILFCDYVMEIVN